jgi:hypothetical protein
MKRALRDAARLCDLLPLSLSLYHTFETPQKISPTFHFRAKPPPHFVDLGRDSYRSDASQSPLYGPPKRRKQPEHYAPFFLEFLQIVNI